MTSLPVKVERGVRQGGVLSTFYYLVYVDQLLKDLEKSKHTVRVMSIKSGNTTFADDISLSALSPYSLQFLLDMVYKYSKIWRFSISVNKSCLMTFTYKRNNSDIDLLLGDCYLQQVQYTTHLGITQDSNLKLGRRITDRCQKAKNSFFAMIGLGLHPQGLNPLTSTSLYKKIIIPTVLYGCGLWKGLTQTDIDTINRFQHFIVKKIQGFTLRTRSDMCESMLGLIRLSAEVEKRKLMFLYKLLTLRSDTVSQQIFVRKYLMYLDNKTSVKYGYVPDICKILYKYELQYIINYYIENNPAFPSKGKWKNIVNKSIFRSESILWKNRLNADRDFDYFKYLHTDIKPAIVYKISNKLSFRCIEKEIATIWSKPVSDDMYECPFCTEVSRNKLVHLVSNCSITANKKVLFLTNLTSILNSNAIINEIKNMSASDFTLKLLGGEVGPILDQDKNILFLKLAFKFILECQQYVR